MIHELSDWSDVRDLQNEDTSPTNKVIPLKPFKSFEKYIAELEEHCRILKKKKKLVTKIIIVFKGLFKLNIK